MTDSDHIILRAGQIVVLTHGADEYECPCIDIVHVERDFDLTALVQSGPYKDGSLAWLRWLLETGVVRKTSREMVRLVDLQETFAEGTAHWMARPKRLVAYEDFECGGLDAP